MEFFNFNQQSPLKRLQQLEMMLIESVESLGDLLYELGKANGPSQQNALHQAQKIFRNLKFVQSSLREEIRNICEYRPNHNVAAASRLGAEFYSRALESLIEDAKNLQENPSVILPVQDGESSDFELV